MEVIDLLERFLSRVGTLASSEEGTTFIEYVVVAAVAVVLILGAVQAFFGGVAQMWVHLTSVVTGSA
jgi:Flp pilus assembly pilin Flp